MLLQLSFLKHVGATDGRGGGGSIGRFFSSSARGRSTSVGGFFVENSKLDFLIFLAIFLGLFAIIAAIYYIWKLAKGPSDPATKGLLDSDEDNDSDYMSKYGKPNYGISNPEEIFSDTRNFVNRANDANRYQKMPESEANQVDIHSQSHRMFDQFDQRPYAASSGTRASNYQHIQEQPSNYYDNRGWQMRE